jgi:hypothetical protein
MDVPAQIEARLHELPSKRRRVVANGLDRLARELVALSAVTDDLRKLEAASRAAADAVELFMTGTLGQLTRLARLLAAMRGETKAEEMTLGELEASGRLQVLALYREVEEESLTVAELEGAGIQRQRLKQLRDQGRLLGIRLPFQRGFLYPRWQFGEDLRPREFLPEVLEAARETGLDEMSVHRFMTRPQSSGGNPTPFELCEQGRVDLALNALRAAGELGG